MRFVSDGGGVRFDIAFEMTPAGAESDLHAHVQVTLSGGMKLLRPLLGRVFKKNSKRILEQLLALLHAPTTARSSS